MFIAKAGNVFGYGNNKESNLGEGTVPEDIAFEP